MSAIRNIGISAHIDAGKTTLSERILFYTGRIHRTAEVHARDGTGATLDFDPLERQKGITIQAAATWCEWAITPDQRHTIQLLDTPGHVDFTIEVERALRVLDGAVLVVCAVAGVQPQTATVDRQMRRHGVPRLVFVNKMDRAGADPVAAVAGLRRKLGLHTAVMQLPVGSGSTFEGVVDLVAGRLVRFEGEHGERVVATDIPDALLAEVTAAREALVAAVAEVDNAIADRWLAALPVGADELHAAIRRATLSRALVPVLFGSAYHNVGVQPLLDAVVRYLPSPADREVSARAPDGAAVPVAADPDGPLVALAFKQDETRFGVLSWLRIYRGRLQKGDAVRIMGTGERVRIARLVRIHADTTVEIPSAEAGDIVAAFGVAIPTGDTLADPAAPCVLAGLDVPEPVVAIAVEPHDRAGATALTATLARLCRADPTLRLDRDAESGQILLRGMGELHLEVALERVRAAGVQVRSGPPQVAFRETVRRAARFDYTLKKQTGGPGQYAKVVGRVEPLRAELGEDPLGYVFVDATSGGAIPAPFVAAFEKGVRDALTNGLRTGSPVVGVRVVLEDGAIHDVDSSERSFLAAGRLAVREAMASAEPVVLEPVMRVVVEAPAENLGSVLGQLATRRGLVTDTQVAGEGAVVEAEVPLTTMFGYISALRSATHGGGSFVMEPLRYAPAP